MEPNAKQATPTKRLELPTLVFGPIELRRLLREIEAVEEYLSQSSIREPGTQIALPKTSRILDALAGNNALNLLVEDDRKRLSAFLKEIEKKAPVIHISFAADPSSAFTAKIVAWLRTNIHPYALLQLGLQPSIAAGCVLRTTNKQFDFSLRNRFLENRDLLVKAISGGAGKL
jgi:F0F1-type ATP synthase delta subunit